MRPKVAFLVVGGGLLVIASLLMLRTKNDNRALASLGNDTLNTGSARDQSVTPHSLPSRKANRIYAEDRSASRPDSKLDLSSTLTPEDFEEAVNNRILELSELALQSDADSFKQILAELTNGVPQIRRAALDAVMQMGNMEAIPVLKTIAEHSTDAREVKDLREAIEFLTLPSLVEVTRAASRPVKN